MSNQIRILKVYIIEIKFLKDEYYDKIRKKSLSNAKDEIQKNLQYK